jgi:uncharacterized membrane protein (UPF0127 family)
MRRSRCRAAAAALFGLWAAASGRAEPAQRAPEVLWLALGGETFELELALDPPTRARGLSGRAAIPPRGGMLFVLPAPRPMGMVMRDCPVAIDVAFLDGAGRVLTVHEMQPEEPRRPGESPADYETRLRLYESEAPAQFAIETAGGRLRAVGLAPGDRVPLDTGGLGARAR